MSVTIDGVPERAAETVDHRSTVAERWRRPLFAVVALELVVLFVPTVAWLFDRWTLSVWHNAHGLLIPPVVAWLAWQELKRRPDLSGEEGSAWGFVFLVPALTVHAIDAGMHTQLLSAMAMFLAIPGLALLLLGRTRARLIGFPLVLLFFALPIPLAFTEPVHLMLRQIAASTTAALLPALGISVFREGTMLYTAAGSVSISDACSGFSTLYASVTVAVLLAYMAPNWRSRLMVLIAAVPVAIAANLLRVVVLTLMVAWGSAWLLETFVHPLSGMLTFALALPVLFWLGGPAKQTTPENS